jgi:hypothetical protein
VKFGASNFTVKLCSLFVRSIGREQFKQGTSPVYKVAFTFNKKRTLAVVLLYCGLLRQPMLYYTKYGMEENKKKQHKNKKKPMQSKG